MSDDGLAEFHLELIAEVQAGASGDGIVATEAFFEWVGDLLVEAGEMDGSDRAYHVGKLGHKNLQVDGYGGDPRESDGILSLVICDFDVTDELRVLHKDGAKRLFERLLAFLNASRKEPFRDQLEETSPGFQLADLISTTWGKVKKVKLVVATNADFRARADGARSKEIDGRPVSLNVWDLKRLRQFREQGRARASLKIDFAKEFGGGIPLLEASGGENALESYLAVIPGRQLADIYEKWGPRLLESNVRSFLQARGKVNRGIRDTIRDAPDMFFPYNNGLSATADGIVIERTENGLELVSADNLQIVNGGQTTASLHAASRTSPDELEAVRVQMKLTIVPSDGESDGESDRESDGYGGDVSVRGRAEEVVSKISEFANTQNKVNAADFFSNHPLHVRLEDFSRRILAPAGRSGIRETKWFYERARGQYADERGRRTPAERKKFDAMYPRSQFFTKTDLAKYANTWEKLPHTVSLGAQKNFAAFAKTMGKRWASDNLRFGETWFKRTVGQAIAFRATEKFVSAAVWYEGGYRANIVTYGLAKLVHDAEQQEREIDLEAIWRAQGVSPALEQALDVACAEAQTVITNPPEGVRNFSEWAKQQRCWKQLEDCALDYPEDFDDVLAPIDTVDPEAEAMIRVVELGSEFWANALAWGKQHRHVTPRDNGILTVCASIPDKMPTAKQCVVALETLEKFEKEGFKASDIDKDAA